MGVCTWMPRGSGSRVATRGRGATNTDPLRRPAPVIARDGPADIRGADLAGLIMVIGSGVLAYLAIRTLGLPVWWILWAPILDGILVGSLDIATMALLIVLGGRLSALAPLLKIYAVLPMAGERRWRSLAVAAVLVAITFPILPWGMFFADLSIIGHSLVDQSVASSPWGIPVLILVFAAGLASLGPRRAGYLAVPILWPRPQLHYSALVLPIASTSLVLTLGFAVGFILPWAPTLAVGVYIAVDLWRRREDLVRGRRLVGQSS